MYARYGPHERRRSTPLFRPRRSLPAGCDKDLLYSCFMVVDYGAMPFFFFFFFLRQKIQSVAIARVKLGESELRVGRICACSHCVKIARCKRRRLASRSHRKTRDCGCTCNELIAQKEIATSIHANPCIIIIFLPRRFYIVETASMGRELR